MRWGLLVGVMLLGVVVALGVAFSVRVTPVFSVCQQDDELAREAREGLFDAGRDFITLIREGDGEALLAAMSSEARQGTDRAALDRVIASVQALPGGDLEDEQVFKLFVLGSEDAMSMCGPPSRPAMMARHGGMHSAVATFKQAVNGAERSWTLYFEREVGAWRVRHFHMGQSGIAGHGGGDFRNSAREQLRAGHTFNATLLYDVAASLLNRGPNFQPPEAYGLAQEHAELQRHPDLVGPAPFTFQLGGASYVINRAIIVGTGDQKVVLLLEQRGGQPVTTAEANERNRALIDAMNAQRPEWREAFDALAASYPTGSNTVWRTVYNREGGYVVEPTSLEADAPAAPRTVAPRFAPSAPF